MHIPGLYDGLIFACFRRRLLLYLSLMTRLTVPISAKSLDEALVQIKAAQTAGAEMLEFRIDYLEGLNIELVKSLMGRFRDAKGKRPPVIVSSPVSTRVTFHGSAWR